MKTNNLLKIILVLIKELIVNLENWNWRKILKESFSKNLKTKSVIMIFTLFFFYYVNLQNIQEKTLFVPLEVKKSDELALVNEIPESITLSLSGSKDDLFNLDINKILAEIDISSTTEEGIKIGFPKVIGIPQRIQVLGISPSQITIELSSLHKKTLKVEPEFIGRLSRDLILRQFSISPNRLEITAPLDIIQDLTSLKTEPIDISTLKSNKEIEVELNKTIHPSVNLDREKKFIISLFIEKRSKDKVISGNYLINVSSLAENLIVDNEYYVNKIYYRLKNGNNGKINFSDYENLFFIDAQNITQLGNYPVTIQINNVIQEVEIIKVEPKQVNLKISQPKAIE